MTTIIMVLKIEVATQHISIMQDSDKLIAESVSSWSGWGERRGEGTDGATEDVRYRALTSRVMLWATVIPNDLTLSHHQHFEYSLPY